MGMKCRPILLHSEFLPAITGEREWDYQVLGHYDGITIKDNIDGVNQFDALHSLFSLCAGYECGGMDKSDCAKDHPYFTQFVFGFHSGEQKEEKFWESKLPFTYLCLIQFADEKVDEYQRYFESSQYFQDERKALGLKEEEKIETQAYYTLDNSDLLLVIKCEYSRTGAMLINNLHQDIGNCHSFKIRNTYSILALKKEHINNKESKFAHPDDKIDLLELRLIESGPDSVKRLYQTLQQDIAQSQDKNIRIKRKALLGAEDEIILIWNMPWNQLVQYYRNNTGILCNSNLCTQKFAYAISCKIMIPLKDDKEKADKEKANIEKENNTGTKQPGENKFYDTLTNNINQIYRNKKDWKSLEEKKTLMMIANALRRFEYSHTNGTDIFSDYNFYQMYFPFYRFIELLNTKGIDKILRNESYFSFIKAMILKTQSFAKPDRVYSLIADFNVRFFDIPSKLVALYSAFVYYFKKILGTGEKQYEFLICPGFNCKIEVKEIFERTDDKNRLFLVEIPEQQLYQPKTMLIILGHEIAHFVGTDIRERDERAENIVNITVRMLVRGMRGYAIKRGVFKAKHLSAYNWGALEAQIKIWLNHYIEIHGKKLNEKFFDTKQMGIYDIDLEHNKEFMGTYHNHSEVLTRTLRSAVRDMLNRSGLNIFSFMIYESFKAEVAEGNLNYNNRQEYYEEKRDELRLCIQAMLKGYREEDSQVFSVLNGISRIVYFMKECYADMLCILMLRLPLSEYLNTFLESIDGADIDVEELMNTEIGARIALVTYAMSDPNDFEYGQSEKLFIWTDEQYDDSENWSEELSDLDYYAFKFCYNYLEADCGGSEEEMILNERNIIFDKATIEEILKYLHICRQKFYEVKKDSEYEDIRQIFSLTEAEAGESRVEDIFAKMMQILKNYETDIYHDMIEGLS